MVARAETIDAGELYAIKVERLDDETLRITLYDLNHDGVSFDIPKKFYNREFSQMIQLMRFKIYTLTEAVNCQDGLSCFLP